MAKNTPLGPRKSKIDQSSSRKAVPCNDAWAYASVLLGREFDPRLGLIRPCKLVLQPSCQTHGVRKSCREHTQNTRTSRTKWTQSWRYNTIVVIKRQQQQTTTSKKRRLMLVLRSEAWKCTATPSKIGVFARTVTCYQTPIETSKWIRQN